MTVFFVDWETMVTIPGVKDCFIFTMGDRPSLVETGLGMVGFTCSMCIKGLESNCEARL